VSKGGARGSSGGAGRARCRRWARPRRIVPTLIALVLGWILLSLVLFLVSSQFERTSLPSNVAGVLDPAGYPLTSVNNILVLGSDRRQKDSKEPGAETTGFGRSDTIMLIRTGDGHAARLSIPRDTVIEIPGHGLQKINAAHEYGGPAESVSVIKNWLQIPINHVVEVNFENFPQLIEAMGGVTYTGGCIVSNLDGGSADGGFTLRLSAGTHHLDGKQALALARTRENLCAPSETDIQREEHQQALFNDMKRQLLAYELLPAAVDRMGRAPGDHLGHERSGTARHVRGSRRHRNAADARAPADRTDRPAQRRRRADDLRRSASHGRRAVHERLSVCRRPASRMRGSGECHTRDSVYSHRYTPSATQLFRGYRLR
jgi:LCP family protein required for cell wall assembly